MKYYGLMKVVNQVGEWFIKLVYANFLWIFFTLIGLGLFGFMPATVGLFTLLRQWIMGNDQEKGYTIFWKTFRKEFLKSNLFGLIFLAIGFILKMDISYFRSSTHVTFQVLLMIMMCLSILFFVTLLNFFPVYVHFNFSFFQYIKYAFLIGMTQISSTLMMAFGAIIIFCLYWYISGIVPLFCMSLLSVNLMWFGNRSFKKIESIQAQF